MDTALLKRSTRNTQQVGMAAVIVIDTLFGQLQACRFDAQSSATERAAPTFSYQNAWKNESSGVNSK